MDTAPALRGLRCVECETTVDPAAGGRCPDCGGWLTGDYAFGDLDLEPATFGAGGGGLGRFAPLLPVDPTLASLDDGGTPLVSVPDLAAELGVETVYVKDEGRNPSGALVDRELAVATAAAAAADAEGVALPTTGHGGQALAAHAARAGLAATAFVPTRVPFVTKAMTNVHGGEMSVVEGRYPDAVAAFDEAREGADWTSLAPFDTPYRHEGAKTLAFELGRQLSWRTPDAVVHPTGHGTGLYGLHRGFADLRETGLLAGSPRLYAAQAAGCAPLADAWAAGADELAAIAHPDTICGALEIPRPAGGSALLDVLEASDGGAVATDDPALLEGALTLAETGLTTSVAGGAALSGAQELADRGALDADDVVVLVNPASGNKEGDVLRSHLMSKGV